MCVGEIFPDSKCSCSAVRDESFVEPRLGLGLSMQWSAGSPKDSMTALIVCLHCVGVSIVIVGPVA